MKTILLLALTCLSVTAFATDESPDAAFYRKATEGGLAEIDGGMLAQQLSKNPSIVRFGEMIVKDHTAANHALREFAATNHVDLPTAPATVDSAKKIALQKLSGDAFDKAYIEWQILSHKDAIALFKEESASGDDIDAKRFASNTLPTLQAHLASLLAMPVVLTPQ